MSEPVNSGRGNSVDLNVDSNYDVGGSSNLDAKPVKQNSPLAQLKNLPIEDISCIEVGENAKVCAEPKGFNKPPNMKFSLKF